MINIIISSCVILGEVQDTLTIRRLKHDIDEEINIHPLLHSDGIQKNTNVCTSFASHQQWDFTLRAARIMPSIKWGGVQLMPTATTFLLFAASAMHSSNESPFTTLRPSLELKTSQDGICISSSSRISTRACRQDSKYESGYCCMTSHTICS